LVIENYTRLEGYRYERKFTAGIHHRGHVDLLVRQNPAVFRQAFQPRQVNNIYFDTPGLDCFFDNLFGVGKRWKARIRWYGEIRQEIQQPILELKLKQGYLNTKKSWPLHPVNLSGEITNLQFLKDVIANSELPGDVRSGLLSMQPVLLNNYQRSYFVSADKNFRLTIDTGLEYRDFRFFANRSNQVFGEKGKIVVELKYQRNLDGQARAISNLIPFRLSKNSKFVSGMTFIRRGVAE